jgi:glucose/arabinose dehydrogenase
MHQHNRRQRIWPGLLILCLGLGIGLIVQSGAGAIPHDTTTLANDAWPNLALKEVITGLDQPVHVTHAGDGSGRLFLVEKPGRINIAQNGTPLEQPFLDITRRVKSSGNEQGLFSVAFPPDYRNKGYFYVNYTRESDGATVIARYQLTEDANVANPDSEEVLLTIAQPYQNHNGGQIAFGPDGYLYIGMGDGGSGGDPEERAQAPGDLLGKLLRIDVETGATPYAIPPTNPYTQTTSYRPEIWALGLRNPWRFSFDRSTGDLYTADVGQLLYEEVNVQPAASPGGENYGWDIMEGLHCYEPSEGCNQSGLTLPVVEYTHEQGNCSVTGGFVYRGPGSPRMQGIYFYGDYCTGGIWGLRQNGEIWENQLLADTVLTRLTSFGEDETGNLYATDLNTGSVYRLIDTQSTYLPVIQR